VGFFGWVFLGGFFNANPGVGPTKLIISVSALLTDKKRIHSVNEFCGSAEGKVGWGGGHTHQDHHLCVSAPSGQNEN
jgi:hypothetical protein